MKTIKKIKINICTYLIIFLYIYSGYLYQLISYIFIFLIHEFGHLFFIKLFKVRINKIDIYPFGGIIHLKDGVDTVKNIFIGMGGIIFQLILLLFLNDNNLININVHLLLINLIPISPLDGGKIIHNIISLLIGKKTLLKLKIYLNIGVYITLLIIKAYNQNMNIFLLTFLFVMIIKEHKKDLEERSLLNIRKYLVNIHSFV